jgi:hypothetical protein
MNFLNNDFSNPESKSFVDDMREFWLANGPSIPSPVHTVNSLNDIVQESYEHEAVGKAGKMGKLFWNTMVLSERSSKNYSRNLLAYGVRTGMYAGKSD